MNHRLASFFVGIALTLAVSSAQAQCYQHSALWLRIAPTYTINKHWTVPADLHYRRQSHPDYNQLNLIRSPLLYAARVGVAYRTAHGQFTVFPVCFFHSYPALGSPADLRRAPVSEWRPSALAEWTLNVSPANTLRLRAGYEYRIFTAPELPTWGRMRFRAAWRRALGPRTYGQLWNETLLAAPPNVPVSGHLFDLNRTNMAVGYAITNKSTLEVGYQFTHRQRRSIVEFDEESALLLTFFINISSSQSNP